MRYYVTGDKEGIAAWVSSRIPGNPEFKNYEAIGMVDDKLGIVGGVVYHDYQPRHGQIQLSFSVEPSAITRRAIKACFNYPFEQLGCRRIYGCISEHNHASLEATRRLGWKEEGRLRKAGLDGEDLIIMALLREENPWK